MENSTDPKRNRPAEEGKQNDPNIRDESAAQPGASTINGGKNDEDNQHLTQTASDDFREDNYDKRADKKFDE